MVPEPEMPTDSLLARLAPPSDHRVAVRVTDDALRWIRSGHPWLYDESITFEAEGGRSGDLAVIFDQKRKFRAIGLYDPASPIRVRVLHAGRPVRIDAGWWAARIDRALELRSSLFKSSETTGIRCISGENDGLGGLVVDLFDTVAVAKLYTDAWFAHLPVIVPILQERLGATSVVLRLARSIGGRTPDGIFDGVVLSGPAPDGPVRFAENALRVEADVIAGQKTGYFLDQRDNRRLVGAASRGARVLDVFSAGGGFTLAAAAGGARSVLSVDISGPALEAVARNLSHNRDLDEVRRCSHRSIRGDAFEVMEDLAAARKRFDIVVVDPPSFARKASEEAGALRAYRRLTELAVALVDDGGLLVQASCSSRVSAADFFDAVLTAARRSGVELVEERRTGHPLDHPIGFQHGEYLKAIFARVRRVGS